MIGFTAKVLTGTLAAGCLFGGSGVAPADGTAGPAVLDVGYSNGDYDGDGIPDAPPVSSSMGSFLGGLNQKMAAAGRIARPTNSAQLQRDLHQAQVWGRNAAREQGYVYEQGVRQQALRHDALVRQESAARDNATETWIQADRAARAAEQLLGR